MDDLTAIFLYLAEVANVKTATAFVADLENKIAWIAAAGFPGVPRDELQLGLRALPYRGRCIYFRTDENTVHVLRVVHAAQDVAEIELPSGA